MNSDSRRHFAGMSVDFLNEATSRSILIWRRILSGSPQKWKRQFSAWCRNVSPISIGIQEVLSRGFGSASATDTVRSRLRTKARGFRRRNWKRWRLRVLRVIELEECRNEFGNWAARWKSARDRAVRS